MERIIPWPELTVAAQTVYSKISENSGRPPIPLGRMPWICFLQLWFNLSDPAVEEKLYDSVEMRSFVGCGSGVECAPDETTVCRFRHLLERNKLGKTLLKALNEHLRRSVDLGKQVFQRHGIDRHDKVVWCQRLRRDCWPQLLP
jgi:IS5 family transposase